MLNQSIDSFGVVANDAADVSQDYQKSEGFDFERFRFTGDER